MKNEGELGKCNILTFSAKQVSINSDALGKWISKNTEVILLCLHLIEPCTQTNKKCAILTETLS